MAKFVKCRMLLLLAPLLSLPRLQPPPRFLLFTLKTPRDLHQRDPKQYPLASNPTPNILKKFYFDVGGQTACFEESSEIETTEPQVSPNL